MKLKHLCALAVLATTTPLSMAEFEGRAAPEPDQPQACCAAAHKNFPKAGGNLGNHSYSALDRINRRNIKHLGAAWKLRMDGGATTSGWGQQSSAIVVDGVMYVQSSNGKLLAVDAATGTQKWVYDFGTTGAGRAVLRGVTVAEGKVFAAAYNSWRVVALDKNTGTLSWQVQLGCQGASNGTTPGCDFDTNGGPRAGYMPTAAVYHDGLIYLGTGGGDGSFRGRAFALRASDGSLAWTFYGTPGPGQPGHETWPAGDPADPSTQLWRTGGAAPWMHPAIDPETDTVYFTFGNAFGRDDVNGSDRPGDNLYSASIVAMNAKTGAYKWHYQTARHDIWDYDNVMAPLLIDIRIAGIKRKAVVITGKTPWLYILDRHTGQPLLPIDDVPQKQEPRQATAATQPIPRGDPFSPLCPDPSSRRPSLWPIPGTPYGCAFEPFWDVRTHILVGTNGGNDLGALSFSPDTGLIYVGAAQAANLFNNTGYFRPPGEYWSGTITAMDPRTNRIAWQRNTPWHQATNGLLTTKGGLIFMGQADGNLVAMDIDDGRVLWSFQTGAGVKAPATTFEVNGEQYVAVVAGGSNVPGYGEVRGDWLWAFKLGGSVPPEPENLDISVRAPIAGSTPGIGVSNTVLLGRTSATSDESITANNAFFPRNIKVNVGETVTFLNPAGSANPHCARSFFDTIFDTGPVAPGQAVSVKLDRVGEWFFNDCVFPHAIGKIVVATPPGTNGDVSQDGEFTCRDVRMAAKLVGTKVNQPGYVPAADQDGNGVISPYDLVLLNNRLPKGMTCP
jgi:glucose dehydrogenase/plastocyanin